MENTQVEANKSQGGCGCQCHNKCGSGMNGCGHCGFWKGLILGVVLCALLVFFCDRVCDRHMKGCFYGSPMMQNQEPSK